MTQDRTAPLRYVLWVGLVVAVQAEALSVDSGSAAEWALRWSPSTQDIETLLRLIGRHDDLAEALAQVSGDSTAQEYRERFPERFRRAVSGVAQQLWSSPDPLADRDVRRHLGLVS